MIDALFLRASELGGVGSDQLKLIFSLLVAYPLASLFTKIPTSQPALRHIYSLAVSAFFLLGLLHLWSGVLHCLASSAFTYIVAYYVRTPNMPWIVFIGVMGDLTVNHVLRTLAQSGYEVIDITGTQMVLAMKLTTFAWNVYDGRQQPSYLDASQAATKITTFPNPLAFLGYVFYFPGILVGPTIEYVYYEQLIDGSLFTATDKAGEFSRIPRGRGRAAYTKLAQALFFLAVFAAWGAGMDYDRILSPEFLEKSFLGRFFFLQKLGFAQRTKYYGVWLLAEGACILTGLGFNGYSKSGEVLWNRAANVDIMNIEFAPSFKVLLDSWNMNTNVWLRNSVYKRVTPKGKTPGLPSVMITFLTSAFWHGVHVGYYLTFFLGGFIQYANRLARQYFRPLFLTPDGKPTSYKPIYDALGVIASTIMLNYAVAPFQLLDLKRSILAWHSVYWHGHILVGVPIIFFLNGGKSIMRNFLASRGIVLPDKRKSKSANGTPSSGAVTPGPLGAPNGGTFNTLPIELAVEEAKASLQVSKKDT